MLSWSLNLILTALSFFLTTVSQIRKLAINLLSQINTFELILKSSRKGLTLSNDEISTINKCLIEVIHNLDLLLLTEINHDIPAEYSIEVSRYWLLSCQIVFFKLDTPSQKTFNPVSILFFLKIFLKQIFAKIF